MTASMPTRRYAVIGHPVAHSRSPRIHGLFAQLTGIALEYGRIDASPDRFEQDVRRFFEEDGAGLNVTVPFKERAFELARDGLSDRATQAGAVNTLWQEDGRLRGCNTDGVGLTGDLQRLGAWTEGVRVLVVGAGGAARGVIGPFLQAGAAHVKIVNRTADRAHRLVGEFAARDGSRSGALSAGGLADAARPGGWDIVINATSSSLAGAAPELPPGLYASDAWAYDMMYGVEPTAFMLQAQRDGARHAADGLGMLVGQAAASFSIWHGVSPDVDPVLAAVRAELDGSV